MHVAIIGGGLGGMATAVRLAKLGHEVTLLEASEQLGGAIGTIRKGDFAWDTGPNSTLLPAVLRDLFRKSGRPLERELELIPSSPSRHVFYKKDKKLGEVDLPSGSRADQIAALDQMGKGLGAQWAAYTDAFADDWEALRKDFYERPWSPPHASKHTTSLMRSRLTLHKAVHRSLSDERLRMLALQPAIMAGQDPRSLPAWMGLTSYLEQNFGRWTIAGGMGVLSKVLTERLGTRGVEVLTNTRARDLEVDGGRVVGVQLADSVLSSDAVVCAIDPRSLPTLSPTSGHALPAMPPLACHLGLSGEVPDIPDEYVVHGDPTLVVLTNNQAPEGSHAWTVLGRGRINDDLVQTLANRGLDVNRSVDVRLVRTAKDMVLEWNGSPYGALWRGRSTLAHMLGNSGPRDGSLAGVYVAGAHTHPGAGLPQVGLSASNVAQLIGPA
jgi:phytoene dehydrogenase-like protein